MTIIVNKKRYPVHKKLLCMRIPYFAKAFENGFEEAQTGEMHLTGTTTSAFELVIHWLYTGQVPKMHKLGKRKRAITSDTSGNPTRVINSQNSGLEPDFESIKATSSETLGANVANSTTITGDISDYTLHEHIEAYLLAEYWCADTLHDCVIDEIVASCGRSMRLSSRTINIVYRRSHSQSHLRRFFTQCVACAIKEKKLDPAWFKQPHAGDNGPCYDFAMDVLSTLGKYTAGDTDISNPCRDRKHFHIVAKADEK